MEFTLVTGDISPRIVRDDEEGGEDEYGEDVDAKLVITTLSSV